MQCSSTRSRLCTRAWAPCPNSGVGTWSLGVFTLGPIKNRSLAPCSGTKSERSLSYLNCVGLQVRNTQPSMGCSSEASPQSLSPSQTYDIMIHLEVFLHLNSVGSHVRWLQAWSAVASSEPSPQSSSPSHTNLEVMQRPGKTK